MNKQNIFSGIFVFVMISFFSCTQILKQEIVVKPSELVVYYDDDLNKMMVLNSGKHTIPRNAVPYFYSLEDINIKERMLALTKDGKEITCSVDYKYHLNSKTIRKLHVEVGSDFTDRLIKSKMRSEMRKLSSTYNFEEIEVSKMEKEMTALLKNNLEYSEYINTKSLKLKIEPKK